MFIAEDAVAAALCAVSCRCLPPRHRASLHQRVRARGRQLRIGGNWGWHVGFGVPGTSRPLLQLEIGVTPSNADGDDRSVENELFCSRCLGLFFVRVWQLAGFRALCALAS